MIKYSKLYNEIKKEIYDTFKKENTVLLMSYMCLIYDYRKKDWITEQEKELLFDLVHYSVNLLIRKEVEKYEK